MNSGYAEAKVQAGEWKGRPQRGWRPAARRQGLTGKALDAWVDRMAAKYPGNVRSH